MISLTPSSRRSGSVGRRNGADIAFAIDEARVQRGKFETYPNYKVFVVTLDDVIAGTYELLITDNLAKRDLQLPLVRTSASIAVVQAAMASGSPAFVE
jgi:hypothetical protein